MTAASSPAENPHLAHHFDDIQQQREAVSLGMWAFLVTEVMFFGGLFCAYTISRARFPLGFAEGSQHLDRMLGAVNTGVLLVSSFTVVLALHFLQLGRQKLAALMIVVTMVLGAGFLGIKAYEYWHKYHEDLIPGKHFQLHDPHYQDVEPRHVQLFLSLYFAMTGLHAAHMLIGIGIFVVLLFGTIRKRYHAQHFQALEIGGLYWHFVDIVWIFLFPLLYQVA